jgi:hypothetical protein
VSFKLPVANRYLRDPDVREKTVLTSVATSSALEGIRAPFILGAQTGASSRVRFKRKKSKQQILACAQWLREIPWS